MNNYRQFGKDSIFTDEQYPERRVFENGNSVMYQKGIRFCVRPPDSPDYYEYPENTCGADELISGRYETDDSKKYCTKKIKVGAKIGISGLLNAFVDFSFKRIDLKEIPTKTTDDHCPEENTEDIGVVIATDIGEKVRGTLGGYIAAAEWVFNSRKCEYELKGFKTRKVDGKTIKENTFYYLENGKFTEAE